MLVVSSKTSQPAKSILYILVLRIVFVWVLFISINWYHDSTILHCLFPFQPLYAVVSLLLYSDLPPLAWALALLLAGKITALSESHPHMHHTLEYALSPWTVHQHLTRFCLLFYLGLMVCMFICGKLVYSLLNCNELINFLQEVLWLSLDWHLHRAQEIRLISAHHLGVEQFHLKT